MHKNISWVHWLKSFVSSKMDLVYSTLQPSADVEENENKNKKHGQKQINNWSGGWGINPFYLKWQVLQSLDLCCCQ